MSESTRPAKSRADESETLRRPDGESALPLYVQLAQTIGERISTAAYPVGSLLPTEAELGASFGVSRYTVRQAIQHLRNQGLVTARKGVGTRVQAVLAESSYSQSMRSLDELLQYAIETKLVVGEVKEVAARGSLAEELGSRPGKIWIRASGVRHAGRGKPPVCFNEIYIDEAYRAITDDATTFRTAIWSLIEKRFGETVVEVDQMIDATVLDEELARELQAKPGSPALKFTRRYFVTGRRLVQYTVSIHPADRLSYHMTIRRERSTG